MIIQTMSVIAQRLRVRDDMIIGSKSHFIINRIEKIKDVDEALYGLDHFIGLYRYSVIEIQFKLSQYISFYIVY